MKRTAFFLATIAGAALLFAATAAAKGASEAKITGKGLGSAITLRGDGEPGTGSKLSTLADEAGFFPAVFGQEPDPMLAKRPSGDLGPKLTITWTVPGPNDRADRVRQELYPYAKDGPLTYMRPGQKVFGGEQLTQGGWFQGPMALKALLEDEGLPSSASGLGAGDDSGFPLSGPQTILISVLAGFLLLGAASALVIRRRPRAAGA